MVVWWTSTLFLVLFHWWNYIHSLHWIILLFTRFSLQWSCLQTKAAQWDGLSCYWAWCQCQATTGCWPLCTAHGCEGGDGLTSSCASPLLVTRSARRGFQESLRSTLPSCCLLNSEVVLNSKVCSFGWVIFIIKKLCICQSIYENRILFCVWILELLKTYIYVKIHINISNIYVICFLYIDLFQLLPIC